MCGIVGLVGHKNTVDRLVDALRRLEYRGYDSAGLCVHHKGELKRRRTVGRIRDLEKALEKHPLEGRTGIAHTRWATHGAPTEKNAHPHCAGRVALVHNGIIENFRLLRKELLQQGRVFKTETDSEVIAHLLDVKLETVSDPLTAFSEVLKQLSGAYALAVLLEGEEDIMLIARRGSPLVLGFGEGEMFLASDAVALAPFVQTVSYLEEGDWGLVRADGIELFDGDDRPVVRPVRALQGGPAQAEKGNYRHFMHKEIHEEPEAAARTLGVYINPLQGKALPPQHLDFSEFERLVFLACGTAWYAGLSARFWFETHAGLPCDVEIASEFHHRNPVVHPKTLAVAISQSGETADTLAALRFAKAQGLKTAALVNVEHSTLAREADIFLPVHAGPEIGVASTKAYIAQLTGLAGLALSAGQQRGVLKVEEEERLITDLLRVPGQLGLSPEQEHCLEACAADLARARDILCLARGGLYPLALEAALKLKETSYIHAEGYPAGELKHGPIALIDEKVWAVFLAPTGPLFQKTLSGIQEVAARGGRILMISDKKGLEAAEGLPAACLEAPETTPFTAPLIYTPLVHMLAYHTAVHKGTDVDQPRNLAKSVTVE